MIAASRTIAMGCIGVAVAVHLTGTTLAVDLNPDAQIAGGQVATQARLGNAFEDLTMGVQSGVETTEVAETPPVEESVEPETIETATVPDQPEVIAALPPTPSVTAVEPPVDTLEATDPESGAVTESLRPRVRSVAQAEPPRRGNAQQESTRGTSAGRETARATQQSRNQAGSTQAGNAAATNYPGEVAQKIRRAGRPRVSDRGTAVVAFRIAANGGLSSLSIHRSSGSPELDEAALNVIQRAAPFPAPPPGAQLSYRIPVERR